LNDALAAAGLGIVAEDDGTGLRIRSEAYGAVGDFELNEDVLGAGTWGAVAGTDVQGTIDGVVAVGSGRRLSLLESADSLAAGLAVDVTEDVTGTSTVSYQAGIAARVAEVANRLTKSEGGVLTTAKQSADDRIEDFNDQITRLEDRLFIRESNMRRQWANLQTVLSQLQSQGSWLSSQLGSLPSNWNG
jgi:flagellar hook-associated protein 2